MIKENLWEIEFREQFGDWSISESNLGSSLNERILWLVSNIIDFGISSELFSIQDSKRQFLFQ